ncbi:MAG: hypothetical protein IIB00_11370, partial [candidate division Zixibacteria bacterium]|nr:hypothetical protein [candidate division Zixibacteria bacterium]
MSFISSQINSIMVRSNPGIAIRRPWGSLFAIIVICATAGTSEGAAPGVGPESVSSAAQDNLVVPDSVFLLCEIETFSFGNVGGLGGSDCWGWSAPDSSEYAIMGTLNGLTFVNVTTLEVVTTIPGPTIACSKYWRDMRTYQHYCYCVSECSGTNQGLMIVDLQYLPDSVHLVGTFDTSPNGDSTSHNLGIDTVTGFLYIVGKTTFPNPAMHIYDLADPENPTFVGSFGNSPGFHDINVHNDTAYIAEGFAPFFSIYDMSVKTPPTLLA